MERAVEHGHSLAHCRGEPGEPSHDRKPAWEPDREPEWKPDGKPGGDHPERRARIFRQERGLAGAAQFGGPA